MIGCFVSWFLLYIFLKCGGWVLSVLLVCLAGVFKVLGVRFGDACWCERLRKDGLRDPEEV